MYVYMYICIYNIDSGHASSAECIGIASFFTPGAQMWHSPSPGGGWDFLLPAS